MAAAVGIKVRWWPPMVWSGKQEAVWAAVFMWITYFKQPVWDIEEILLVFLVITTTTHWWGHGCSASHSGLKCSNAAFSENWDKCSPLLHIHICTRGGLTREKGALLGAQSAWIINCLFPNWLSHLAPLSTTLKNSCLETASCLEATGPQDQPSPYWGVQQGTGKWWRGREVQGTATLPRAVKEPASVCVFFLPSRVFWLVSCGSWFSDLSQLAGSLNMKWYTFPISAVTSVLSKLNSSWLSVSMIPDWVPLLSHFSLLKLFYFSS